VARQANRYRTQWAAQFFAAAELTRRDYLVALTLGNAPHADLLVESPTHQQFSVDVKGLAGHNWWLVRERPREDQPDIYFLVHVPNAGTPPEYFVLTSDEMMAEMEKVRQTALAAGQAWTGKGSGIKWGTATQYVDRWDVLPK
jgi:hypothetical protein